MRKFVMLLVLLIVACCSFGIAESFELDSFNGEDLMNLYDELKEEMYERGILRRGTLHEGIYVIGKDVAAGSYEVTAGDMCTYYVFNTEELYNDFLNLSSQLSIRLTYEVAFDDETKKLDLRDGQVLTIASDTLILSEIRNGLTP